MDIFSIAVQLGLDHEGNEEEVRNRVVEHMKNSYRSTAQQLGLEAISDCALDQVIRQELEYAENQSVVYH